MRKEFLTLVLAVICLGSIACGDSDDLDSDAEARWSYLGLDAAVDRAIGLGFDGFNAATSANIPAQTANGTQAGTMDVTGQVDQGASANKEMRLLVSLVAYRDDSFDDPVTEDDVETLTVTYDTDAEALPLLNMSLRNIPSGTFTGDLSGTFIVSGDVSATATFALQLSGSINEDPPASGSIVRTPGTLTISGTVTSNDGTYNVNVTK